LSKGGQAAHLTTAARERIVARLNEGVPVAAIATEFAVARNTIYRIRAALPGRRRPAHAPSELVSFRVSAAEKKAFDEALARAGLVRCWRGKDI